MRIVVKPGGCLLLQKHHHRSERWIVLRGATLSPKSIVRARQMLANGRPINLRSILGAAISAWRFADGGAADLRHS